MSLGSLLAIREMNIHASIIQTNEWPTAYLKAYLQGRERIDLSLANLRFDSHFVDARVISVFHNLHKDYHGRIFADDRMKRDVMIREHLGFDPELDWDILVHNSEWNAINPTFTAFLTCDYARTVSKGYHDRSLDMRYNKEFGYLVPLFIWKEGQKAYDGKENGIGLVDQQKKLFGFSFLEIGHEADRRKLFENVYNKVIPENKRKLQKAFGFVQDKAAYLVSMMHRIDKQKGHQLLVAETWSKSDPGVLKNWYKEFEDIDKVAVPLQDEQREKLEQYADEHGRETLRALEVALILIDNLQMLVVGSAEEGEYLDRNFQEMAYLFPNKFKYVPHFINVTDDEYLWIYSGSDDFDMPSSFEPCGLSQKEAAGGGVVCHKSRRDGLRFGEIRIEGKFAECFEPFNPAAWAGSLLSHHKVYTEDPEFWKELRYIAITQDNRWLASTKDYVELYRRVATEGRRLAKIEKKKHSAINKDEPVIIPIKAMKEIAALQELEVAAAIHRANMQNDADPANELMKAGFESTEAARIAVNSLRKSKNKRLLSALIVNHLPNINKIPEVKAYLDKELAKGAEELGVKTLFRRARTSIKRQSLSLNRNAKDFNHRASGITLPKFILAIAMFLLVAGALIEVVPGTLMPVVSVLVLILISTLTLAGVSYLKSREQKEPLFDVKQVRAKKNPLIKILESIKSDDVNEVSRALDVLLEKTDVDFKKGRISSKYFCSCLAEAYRKNNDLRTKSKIISVLGAYDKCIALSKDAEDIFIDALGEKVIKVDLLVKALKVLMDLEHISPAFRLSILNAVGKFIR